MSDPNSIKAQISRTNNYKGLLDLRKDIRGLYGKYPFSIFVDLRGRIEEKINTFNSPMCDQASISVIKKDGNTIPLENQECHYAVTNNIRLSEFIFSKYPDADDFRISVKSILGSYGAYSEPKDVEKGTDTATSRPTQTTDPQIDVLQSRVEYLIKLMDHMSRTYGEAIPKIVNDVKEITERLDELYRKIVKDEVEQ